jgi:hypothetical protein
MKLNTLTLKDIPFSHEAFVKELRDEVGEWRDALKEALEQACKKHEGVYNNVELEIEGVIYEASAFGDDEAKPIIKFINQFFNLEGENDETENWIDSIEIKSEGEEWWVYINGEKKLGSPDRERAESDKKRLEDLKQIYMEEEIALTQELSVCFEKTTKLFNELSDRYDLGLSCPYCGVFSAVTPQMEGEICEICKKGVLRNEWRLKL